MVLGHPCPTCCPFRSEVSIFSSLITRNNLRISQKVLGSTSQYLSWRSSWQETKGLSGHPDQGLLLSWGPSPQMVSYLPYLNSRQRGFYHLPGTQGVPGTRRGGSHSSGFPSCILSTHPGFLGQFIVGSLHLCWARMGWVPSSQQAWEASLGFSGKLCNVSAFFCGLSMVHLKDCWVCKNYSQQYVCESSSIF